MSEKELENVFRIVKNIYNIVNKIYSEDPDLNANRSKNYFLEGPSSHYQTNNPNIFILQMYYGAPHYVHSYLGKHSITGSTSSKGLPSRVRLNEYLNKELGLKLIEEGDYEGGSYIDKFGHQIPKRFDNTGYYGPWYQITKCGSENLNSSILKDRKSCYKCNCRKWECICPNI